MIIPISPPSIPDWLWDVAKSRNLNLKSEFHLTIASSAISSQRPELAELIQEYDWRIEYLPEYYLASKHYPASERLPTSQDRVSIIQRVDCPTLIDFCRDVGLPVRFAHVTLFMSADGRGIGIISPTDDGLNLVALEQNVSRDL